MDFKNILKSEPIKPYINADGWYAQCNRCHTEITPDNKICPTCNQIQDWSWLITKQTEENS